MKDPAFRSVVKPGLRALLAEAHGDETSYHDYRDCYRAMARTLSFEGAYRLG